MAVFKFLPFFVVFIAIMTYGESSGECTGKNLLPDDKLRIGIKYRPPVCDRKSKKGDMLIMHYEGKLYSDCTVFDSSRSRDSPFTFVVGSGQVIRGWDQGLLGMCTGEKRKLTIPSNMAYGTNGAPPSIPAGATLVFDVELVSFST
jgi:FKBP-type peptidyl-prolyl cis-trans isomerase